MIQEYQLRILPEIAANEQKLKEYLSKEKGLNLRDITATRILKRSIDARQRTIFVNLKVRAYIKEMPQEDEYERTIYNNVEGKPQVIVVGAGPGGLFAALRLVELGLRPIVIERGKDVRERKKDLAQISREHTVDPEKVGVIMGSDSDLPVVEKAMDKLKEYGVPYEVHVYSAHRTPEQAGTFARTAQEKGFGVIIAAAGKAAHLAGALAANTVLPVIGIPVKSSTLDGLDALLSTVQMPTGIPVATVAIDGAANAALLAIQILAVSDADLADKLRKARAAESQKVLEKNAKVEEAFNAEH